MSLLPLPVNAHLATYPGAALAVTAWGLHLSDFAVIVSSMAAVCGAVTQILSYLERRREAARGVKAAETYQNGTTD